MGKAIDDAYNFDESVLPTYIDAERLLRKLKEKDALPEPEQCDEERCELLLYFDKDQDGSISMAEAMAAINLYNQRWISQAEALAAINCWLYGPINNVCPECYTKGSGPKLDAPTDIKASELRSTYVDITWKEEDVPDECDWGPEHEHRHVYYRNWFDGKEQAVITDAGHADFDDLAPGSTHRFELQATAGSPYSDCNPSNIISFAFTLKEEGEEEIDPPEYIKVSRSRDVDIPINWGSPLDGYVPIPYTESVTVKNPFYRSKITGELFGEFAGFFDGRGYEGEYVIAEWQATSCEKKPVPLEKGYVGKVEYDLCKKGFAHLILTEWPDVEEEGPGESDMCTINIPTPGYLIDGAKTPVTLKCEAPLVPTKHVDDFIYECTKTISVSDLEGNPVSGCDEVKLVIYKYPEAEWALDEVKSDRCSDIFHYAGTTTSITLTIQPEETATLTPKMTPAPELKAPAPTSTPKAPTPAPKPKAPSPYTPPPASKPKAKPPSPRPKPTLKPAPTPAPKPPEKPTSVPSPSDLRVGGTAPKSMTLMWSIARKSKDYTYIVYANGKEVLRTPGTRASIFPEKHGLSFTQKYTFTVKTEKAGKLSAPSNAVEFTFPIRDSRAAIDAAYNRNKRVKVTRDSKGKALTGQDAIDAAYRKIG